MDSPNPSKTQSTVGTVLSIYTAPRQPGPARTGNLSDHNRDPTGRLAFALLMSGGFLEFPCTYSTFSASFFVSIGMINPSVAPDPLRLDPPRSHRSVLRLPFEIPPEVTALGVLSPPRAGIGRIDRESNREVLPLGAATENSFRVYGDFNVRPFGEATLSPSDGPVR